jgi:CheY-like chemotaxis protein
MALKILTVDDSKMIRMVVKKAFKQYDCELIEAENGVEGLAAASREKPDLIVLDITMPVMTGVEMLERLKGEPSLKDIPVIMLTAEAAKDNVTQILKLGVKDYMVKPFKGEQLIERVTGIVKLAPKKEVDSEGGPLKFFSMDGNVLYLVLPARPDSAVITVILGQVKSEMKKAADARVNKLIFDLRKISEVDMSLIKLIILVLENCLQLSIRLRTVGPSKLSNELKAFQETAELPVYQTVEDAKAAF